MATLRRLIFTAVLLTACGAPTWRPPASPWIAVLDRDHPLVGRIWHARAHRFVTEAELLADLKRADFVLLGEKHDQPDHHRLQAQVLRGLVQAGRKPALRLEMLTPAQQPALDAWLATHPHDAAGLALAVRWQDSGWPDFALYAPIVQVALDARLPIGPANLDRASVHAVAQRGLTGLDPQTRARMGLDLPFDPSSAEAMRTEVVEAHCGQLPETAAEPMALAQRARDAAMADVLLQGATADGEVLIAGLGHVRTDRAVAAWLRRRAPDRRVVALGFVEVSARAVPDETAAALAVDYVWFTPRLDDDDPCEVFRRQLERMRRK